ncbi:hypothetical protein CBM2633_P160002 [Cupriavidus taiwanensis]|uniref:Uncharacterized protein n=1 Tax=Cupriavidus taiwanensis TaxID=164546 RepID=A0A375GL21_9BURK|nr:hypothetical protein CBM2588_P180002 [Cupriavidus taiwanensis]SOZ16276.1 hypothetical protein CBM2597_P110003 [Cupriavidus taiwanensis]SOZ94984.1 hypothetical protein CBM2598_P100003 [Cupriavidus taiwanensis]SPA21508.1 hypothetical protein CBM2631_P200002 [Cupriavidus taiwanensis]SPA23194.1 hypothetical protein CBM2633_P160002 [Cupriavidus taiwanensis]
MAYKRRTAGDAVPARPAWPLPSGGLPPQRAVVPISSPPTSGSTSSRYPWLRDELHRMMEDCVRSARSMIFDLDYLSPAIIRALSVLLDDAVLCSTRSLQRPAC